MAHHKRGRAKNQRAGCLLCKPHKANGADGRTLHDMRADDDASDQLGMLYGAGFGDPCIICGIDCGCDSDCMFDPDDPDTPERYWSDWLDGLEADGR